MRIAILVIILVIYSAADWFSDYKTFTKSTPLTVPTDFKLPTERYEVERPCDEGGEFKLILQSEDGTTNSYIAIGAKDDEGNTKGTLHCNMLHGDAKEYNFKMKLDHLRCKTDGYKESVIRILKSDKDFAILDNGRVPYKVRFGQNAGGCSRRTEMLETEIADWVPDNTTMKLHVYDKSMFGESPDWYLASKESQYNTGSVDFGAVEKYGVIIPCTGVHFKISLKGENEHDINAYIEMKSADEGTFYCKNGATVEFKVPVALQCFKGVVTYRMFKTARDIKLVHDGQKVFYKITDGDCYIKTTDIKVEVFDDKKAVYFSVGERYSPGSFFDVYKFTNESPVNDRVILRNTESFFVVAPCKDTQFRIMMYGPNGFNMYVQINNMRSGSLRCGGADTTDFDISSPTLECFVDNFTWEIEKNRTSMKLLNQGHVLFSKTFTEADGRCREPTTRVKAQVLSAERPLYLKVA